jgi:CRISPR-associated protein Csm5
VLRYNFALTPLTPIHVGTGETISPFEYLLREPVGGDQAYLFRFDPQKVMARLSREKPNRAEEIVKMEDYRRAALALQEEVDVDLDVIYRTPAGAIADLYFEKRSNPENQLLVHTMQRNPRSGAAIIPGSSLKGAVRTALLAEKLPSKPVKRSRVPSEGDFVGWTDPKEDPFRALKIADSIFPSEARDFVAEVCIYSRKKNTLNSIQMIFEQLDGVEAWSPDQDPGVCQASIDDHLSGTPPIYHGGRNPWRGMAFSIDMEEIAAACNRFYGKRLREENRTFFRHARGSVVQEARGCFDRLEGFVENLPANTFIVRLGRFSHFECVTLDGGRASSRVLHGASRSLSNGTFPLGWLAIHWEQVKGAPGI